MDVILREKKFTKTKLKRSQLFCDTDDMYTFAKTKPKKKKKETKQIE